MGTVYEASRDEDGLRVAIKSLHAHLAGDTVVRARFEREGEALRAVVHPNVVGFVATLAEPPALVLTWVEGEPLDAVVARDGPLSVPRAMWIVAELADALAAVHACGFPHRDLQGSNG